MRINEERNIEMTDHSLDEILAVLENPTRRRILQKISRERHYPLQLSKELKVSQQAIVKHLKVLENFNLVKCKPEKSDAGGPERKCYVASYNFSLMIDYAPNLFSAELKSLNVKTKLEGEYKELEKKWNELLSTDDPKKRLNEISDFLHRIDEEINDLEAKRAQLMGLKNEAMREAHTAVEMLNRDYDERRLLYYMLGKADRNLARISERLNLREKVVKDMLRRLGESEIVIEGGA
ncbi:MAG: helix-turn-helix domain-containing protein [Thermoplasmata archaeon]|nr:helix-turn-helix domain-containing protein [Thermoplasmata archaeon]